MQIVNGRNYRFTFSNSTDGSIRTAIVYVSFSGQASVSSYNEEANSIDGGYRILNDYTQSNFVIAKIYILNLYP